MLNSNHKVQSIYLEKFTAFEQAYFDFSPGLNVFIGPNGTGKSHLLKIVYAMLKGSYHVGTPCHKEMNRIIDEKLRKIFCQHILYKLIHFSDDNLDKLYKKFAYIVLKYADAKFELHINNSKHMIESKFNVNNISHDMSLCYIPAQEFLSINQGFISTYQKRELPYDSTYYDLSIALNALPLRQDNLSNMQEIINFIEDIINAKKDDTKDIITQENGRFYFHLPEGRLDSHLVAEGLRKIATLYYLLKNGSLTQDSILFWDEPEANLNPKLIVKLVHVLKQLVSSGVQIFIATHDYLLSHELSLLAEYPDDKNIEIKFFALHKTDIAGGVQVESGNTLAQITNNPILEEFAAHYDREAAFFNQIDEDYK